MPWCCEEFEKHLGTFASDSLRVNYAILLPPAFGRKLFWLERQNSDPVQILSCPWCGANLASFPTPEA